MINNQKAAKSIWQYFTSSHGVILLTYTLGFAVLALLTAIIISYISTKEAESVFIDEGRGFVKLAAQSAVVPLLTGSAENSNDFLNPLLSYQNVSHISVYDRENNAFFTGGKIPTWIPERDILKHINHARLIHEDNDHWYFAAPVVTEGKDRSWIGYVFMDITKQTVNTLGSNILTYTIWICGIAALILWLMLYLVLRRVTLPIRKIAGLMDLSRGVKQHYPVPKHIPSDVKTIYSSFNNMLDQIKSRDKALTEHVSNMEHIVEVKTRDLTEKNIQLEDAHNKAVAAGHAKDLFVANVSHELRTPIQAILGNCELLGDKYQDKELAKIVVSANQLLNLVNNILDLSKIENDKLHVRPRTMLVVDIMTQIAEAIAPVIEVNNNSFEIDIDENVYEVTTDPEMIAQIINNLLSNAGRYTNNGHVTFRVSKKCKHNIDFIYFEVIDNGIGIAKDKLGRIFQPFEQVDMSKTRLYGGTGLGLAISKRLAKLLGGEITVQSEPGKGSTFSLCIPEGEPMNETFKAHDQPTIEHVAYKILLAEDHPFISDAVKQLLESDGHEVKVAINGTQALELLRNDSFEIALIDVHMPELDGIEVIRKFQASRPDAETKLFLLTADVTEALRQQAEQLGIKIIQKPFNRAQLAAQLIDK